MLKSLKSNRSISNSKRDISPIEKKKSGRDIS